MTVTAVAVDECVFAVAEDRSDADGDRLLPAVEVAEPADLPALLEYLVSAFLEFADEHHHPQPLALNLAIAGGLTVRPGRGRLALRRPLAGGFSGGSLLYFIGYGHFACSRSSPVLPGRNPAAGASLPRR